MITIVPTADGFNEADVNRSLFLLDENNPLPPKSFLQFSNTEETIIWLLDKEGVFTFSEGDGLALLDLKSGGLVGKSIFDIFTNYPDITKCIRQTMKGKSCQSIDEINGKLWKMWAYPVRDKGNNLTGISGVFVNITEQYQRERIQKIVLSLSNTLRNVETSGDIPAVILDRIMSIVSADAAMLFWRKGVAGVMRVELGRGAWESWSGKTFDEKNETLRSKEARRVFRSGKPYLGSTPAFLAENTTGQHSPLHVYGVPLVSMNNVAGAIWVGREKPFFDYETMLLKAIGEIAANSIRSATQHTTTQRRLQRLVALHNIDKAISNSLELHVTLNVLLEQVVTQLGIHAAMVYLVKPYTQTMEYAAGRGIQMIDLVQTELPLGEGLAGQVAVNRKFLYIQDLHSVSDAGRLVRKSFFEKEGIVSYCGIPLLVKGQVKGVLEIYSRQVLNPEAEWVDFLETLATQAAIAIDNAELFQNLQKTNAELSVAYDATLEGWVHALDLRDKETEGHTKRVTEVTLRLARALGIGEADLMHTRRGALLHDIGKMAIPDAILYKPGPLNEHEWEIMRKHPVYAYQLLSPIRFLRQALAIPYYHHEKWDGSGYPFGLSGERIPRIARIFAVADVWDALRSDRPYRKAWQDSDAKDYLRENAGKHFDPDVVHMFFRIF